MPEHYTARSEERLAAVSTSVQLACYSCKRRKVKCDRRLPTCSLCQKVNAVCEYPTHAEKPGPKTGTLPGSKRRRLDHHHAPSTPGIDRLLSAAGVGIRHVVSDTARRDSVSSVPGPDWPGEDAAPPQGEANVATPENRPRELSISSPSSFRPSISHPTSVPIFSRIMYPSHEAHTRPQSPSTVDTPPEHQAGASRITVQSVCDALNISKETYEMLMKGYFANMTAFSLFRPGSIEPKFAAMKHDLEAEALVAAMFSFSARHCHEDSVRLGDCPGPSYFSQIASSRLDESVNKYGDTQPPFWLLQAGILVTFYQLTLSVRSKSWKKLGDCIRYSYDMNMHLVDANHDPATNAERSTAYIHRWVLLEERRRAWWAIWEMDVFASTIRRLPTAIDPSLNLTMLPVPDNCWFNDLYQESCFLSEDCNLRWKHLTESGNQSAKAWFIVVNSLMRNTQRIVYPVGSTTRLLNSKHTETNQDELVIMANCLYCTTASLPASLIYQGEVLDFRSKPETQNHASPHQDHADKYSIHLMTQLCRFMIYHHKICARAPWLRLHPKEPPHHGNTAGPQHPQAITSEWSNYMSASDEIVTMVRNSARDHFKYVNPFLANTLWFAAAAQCACKVFGPATFNKRLASSNLDMLKLTLDRFISFWGGMENLKGRLARIESGLQSLMVVSQTAPRNRELGGQKETGGAMQSGGSEAGRSMGAQFSLDTGLGAQHVAVTGTEPMLLVPGDGMNGWNDPKWFPFPDLADFTQQFPVTSQNFYSARPMDISPFGLEELLMVNMEASISRTEGT